MPAITPAQLSHLLLVLYGSLRRDGHCGEFLAELIKLSGVDGAGLVHQDLKTGRPVSIHSGYDATSQSQFETHYASVNPWMPQPQGLHSLPRGNVVSSDSVLPLARLRKTEFYNDWGKRNNVVHSVAANLSLSERDFLYLAVNNGHQRGPHRAATSELLGLLIPHMHAALGVQLTFQGMAALAGVLDSLTVPAFLLDSDGHIHEMSDLAKRILAQCDGFSLHRGMLTAAAHPLQKELYDFARQPLPHSRIFCIPRANGQQFFAVLMKPNLAKLPLLSSRILLVLIDPNSQNAGGIGLAAKLFCLTPAETAFVQTLVETGSLERTIELRRITRNTARTQMTAIFRKTSTNRQGQVIRLFSTIGRITQMGDDKAVAAHLP